MSSNLHPLFVIPVLWAAIGDYLRHAYSTPTPALSSAAWPILVGNIIPGATRLATMTQPCIVINARSGNTHANSSQVLELLFRSYADHSKHCPNRRPLRVTFLHISQCPQVQRAAADIVAQSALYTIAVQILLATVAVYIGLASAVILAIAAADTLAGLLVWEVRRCALHHNLRSARSIPHGQREVLCITTGTKATDAMVVVSEEGAARLEDLAEGREPPPTRWARAQPVCAPLLILVTCALSFGFSYLGVADAWCLIGVWTPGFAHAAYAARVWRSPTVLGFKITEPEIRVVQADTDRKTLLEVKSIEHDAGQAFMSVFFPERGRPEEDA